MTNKQKLPQDELMEKALVPEHEWPYKLPKNWEWVRLGKIVNIKTGKEDANFATEKGKHMFFTCAEEPLLCDLPAFSGESILIAGNGMFHVNYYDGEFNAYQRTYVLQNFKNTIGKFLYFHIKNSIDEITKNNRGSTIQYIRLGDLTSNLVPMPTLTEQQRIVDFIEKLFEKLDQAKELIQEILETFKNRKAAILHSAFSGKLTKKWREENGIEMESWRMLQFKHVADIKSNLVNPVLFEDYPHIAPDNIQKHTGKLLDYRSIKMDGVKSGKHRFYSGQILYSKIRPYLSKVIIVDFEGLCSADMYPIEAKENVKYLWYYMLSESFLAQASSAGSRSVLPKINQKELSKLMIRIPSLEEQDEITRILDSVMINYEKAQELCELIEVIEGMKKSILVRAFRGELGTNNSLKKAH